MYAVESMDEASAVIGCYTTNNCQSRLCPDQIMEAILKELSKLESKTWCSSDNIDAVQASIDALERWKAALEANTGTRSVNLS